MLQWPWRQYKWFERFCNGCELLEEEERSGCPSTSKIQENVERVSEMIWSNRRLTIREISEGLNIYYGSVQNILTTDLNMRRVSAKFVPCVLTVEQKQERFSISLELRDHAVFRFQLFRKCHHGRWNLGLWLWFWDKGSEFTQFSSCEKNTSIKIQHQGDDDCVFWPWWNCASWVCTQEHYGELWIL